MKSIGMLDLAALWIQDFFLPFLSDCKDNNCGLVMLARRISRDYHSYQNVVQKVFELSRESSLPRSYL